jgi:hypothetical protein
MTLTNPRSRDQEEILDQEGLNDTKSRSRITEEPQDAERHCCKLNDRRPRGSRQASQDLARIPIKVLSHTIEETSGCVLTEEHIYRRKRTDRITRVRAPSRIKAFDRQYELGHELRQTKVGQHTPTHMWKNIRNAMRIYTRFHVTGGVLTVLDEEHMQDTHGKILTRHEYNCMERSDTMIDGTNPCYTHGWIYLQMIEEATEDSGQEIGWYDRARTHAISMHGLYLQSHMGYM